MEGILEELYRYLIRELEEPGLTNLPKDLYRQAADQVRRLRNGMSDNDKSIVGLLAEKELTLLGRLVSRLLQVRLDKALRQGASPDWVSLTPEERYVVGYLNLAHHRLEKVLKSIELGRRATLERIAAQLARERVVARFLKPHPSFIGTDLARYGPFEAGDVALIPLENLRPLLQQGVAEELWDVGG